MLETQEIIDISDDFPTAIKAQKKENNALILRNITPIKRLDGKMACYELEYIWYKPDTNDVLGSEYSYWTKKEIKWDNCLFEQVNLF